MVTTSRECVRSPPKFRASGQWSPLTCILIVRACMQVPSFMAIIARDKARAVLNGKELKAPSLLATGVVYMLPWILGFTKEIPVQGSVLVMLPGLEQPGVFVVNGAPSSETDLAIAEESLKACGLKKKQGVWRS